MKPQRTRFSPYRLIFLLPMAFVVLVAGGLNLVSLNNLRQDYLAASNVQAEDMQRVKAATTFNQEVAAIQHLVATTLEQASAGHLDEAEVYAVHTRVVNQLALLAKRIPALSERSNDENDREVAAHFEKYRSFIIQATDLVALDPKQAMSFAYQAGNQYLFLSEHTRALATRIVDNAEKQNQAQEKLLDQHAFENVVIGGVLVVILMLIWGGLIHILTRRLSALSAALEDLSHGEVNLTSLPEVTATAQDKRSLLRQFAYAILAFRETSLAHRTAQYELGERMKELSCLFDVFRITQREDLSLDSMMEAVAARLPEAMRFPEIAAGVIECGERRFGPAVTGELLASSFAGEGGRPARIFVVYSGSLPMDAGEPFLAEEQHLLDAIAGQLAGAIERRKIVADERDRQALLDAVIAGAPDAIQLIDTESLCFVEVNSASCRLLGYVREELIGMPLTTIQAPMDPAMLRAIIGDIKAKGEAHFETCHLRKDGQVIDVRVSVRAIRQNDRGYQVAIWRDITEEKRAAAEIQKLSLVIEQSPFSVVITDMGQSIEYVNDAFVLNTGYEREAVLGRTPSLLKSGKTPAATYQSMWKTLSEGKTWKGEFINRTQEGREQIEAAIIVPLRQADGEITHYVAIKEDVTEKRQMSDELDRHRAHLEQLIAARTGELNTAIDEQNAIFDAASAGIVLLRERVIVRCNHRTDEMFGYGAGEQIGKPTRIWYADDASWRSFGENLYPRLAGGQIDVQDFRFMRKDGSFLWCRVCSRAVDPADLSKGVVVIFEDITAERVAAEALRLASEEQQAIFDTANSGIALIRDRIILRGNRRLHEMFGWQIGQMIGRATALWYSDDAACEAGGGEVYEQIWRGEVHRRDQALMRQDGSMFWARLTGTAVDVGDHSKGTVWVIEDISAERAAIEQMRNAQSLAEEAVRMKSDFLANMSHEIRTPMNAIIGMSHLAMRTELTPRQRDYLKKIQGSSQHLLGIINDILDLSKIEAGKMVVEHIDFELDRAFENVVGLIAEKAAAKDLELIIDIDEGVPRALIGDPLRLGQILINYANNAVKFTERGEIAIHVSIREQTDQDVLLHFSVTDTGIGIEEEQRRRLFQSFEQADTSTTRKFGGTGLGLSISRQLAALMGGEVGVVSEVGKGSSFWFTARLGRGEERSRRLLPDPDLRSRRVLVVDDNEYARAVIGDILRSMTFHVSSVSSGRDAITEITRAATVNEPYEVVFLDWQMPGMDGLETARKIQKVLKDATPHMLMITAYGRDEVMKAASEAGIEDVLIKPVTASLVFDTVMRILGGEQTESGRALDLVAHDIDLSPIAGARILVVEDNDLNQEVATELLRDAGFTVALAENGALALEMISQNNLSGGYDAVLMDMQMPVMDGVTATREIRKLAQWADLPIIAMTANAMSGDRERCLAAGMNDHLTKPIDPDELWEKLLQWIKPLPGRDASIGVPANGGEHPASIANRFAGIAGLDAALGLRQSMGREALYASLLSKFIAGQADFPERIEEALASSDWLLAERLAHTLRGVAAQIGATDIRDRVEIFELGIKDRQSKVLLKTAREEISSHLRELLGAIRSRLPIEKEAMLAVKVDSAELQSICSLLARQLAADDFLCTSTLEEKSAVLRLAMGERFGAFSAMVDDYNFEGALQFLSEFSGEQGLSL